MLSNAHLLAAFKDRDVYIKYIDRINLSWLTFEAEEILKSLKTWYQKNEVNLDLDLFVTYFFTIDNPELPRSKAAEYNAIFKKIASLEEVDIVSVLTQMQKELTVSKLKESLDEGFHKDNLIDILEEYKDVQADDDEFEVDRCEVDVANIISKTDRSKGLRWRMPCLNKSIGPIIKGDSILAAAYVGAGKTAFAISEVGHIAQQLTGDQRVLWLNNEELDERVILKIMKSVLNCSADKIKQNEVAATKSYTKRMNGDKDRILLYNIKDWSVYKIKRLCMKIKPALIVIDQVDKVSLNKHKENSADYIRLGNLYAEIRELAKTYAPVLGISQCDATVKYFDKETQELQYKRKLDMSQLRGSKVDKPGELDIIIMIGQDKTYPNQRYINVAKQKQEGEEPNWMGLSAYEVNFDGDRCRYTDTWKTQEKANDS